jgi:hypothetical protein
MFDPGRVKGFLETVSREKWCPRWCSWLVENSKHRVLDDRLPPAAGT